MKCNSASIVSLAGRHRWARRTVLTVIAAITAATLPAREILDARRLAASAPEPGVVTIGSARSAGRAPTTWPRPAAVPALRVVPRHDDDQPGRWLQIDFHALALRLDAEQLSEWTRHAAPQRYALEWTHRWSPEVRLGVADAPRHLLPNLEDAAWKTYLAQLRREFGSRFQLALDDDSATRGDAVRILGGRTRVLRYDLAPEMPNQPPQRVTQIFVATDRGVLVFACEGPPRSVAGVDFAFESLLIRAERAP